jgi:hypothetical protein
MAPIMRQCGQQPLTASSGIDLPQSGHFVSVVDEAFIP